MFAMGFHEAPRPALCWMQIGLHVPHDARPTRLLRHNLWEGVSFLWKAVKSPDPNGFYGQFQKTGESTEWARRGSFRAKIRKPASLGLESAREGFGAEGGT
jgi:hypothetical protein